MELAGFFNGLLKNCKIGFFQHEHAKLIACSKFIKAAAAALMIS